MEAIPKDVIECAIFEGQIPQRGEGAAWCEQHGNCYRCAKDIHDTMVEELKRLKAERDRALAELDKALGEREDAMLSERNAAFNAGYDEGFASADDWLVQHEDEMAEHGWVRLPVDADGEPIHMGDLVTVPWKDKVYEVAGFSCTKQLCSGIRTIWIDVYSPEKQRNVPLCGADSCRHYHAPTVEDVLEELLREYERDDSELTNGEIIERFAAKLRLAGDAK